MKKSTLALALLSSATMAASASASLTLYEPFAPSATGSGYASGSTIAGQTDTYTTGTPTWVEAGTVTGSNAHQIASGNLTGPTGFPASIGNSGVLEGTDFNDYEKMPFAASSSVNVGPGASGTLYYSFLLDIPSTTGLTTLHSNANAANDVFIAYNNTTTGGSAHPTTFGGGVTIRLGSASADYNLGIRSSTTAANATYWSADLAPNTTYLIVAAYNAGNTQGTSTSSIWVSPASSTFGGTVPSADGTTTGDLNASASADYVESLVVGGGVATGAIPNQVDIDEIRVGTTWADVTAVPEPASLGLLGIGAIAAMRRQRRTV